MNILIKKWLCLILTLALFVLNGCGGVDTAVSTSEIEVFSSYPFYDAVTSSPISSEPTETSNISSTSSSEISTTSHTSSSDSYVTSTSSTGSNVSANSSKVSNTGLISSVLASQNSSKTLSSDSGTFNNSSNTSKTPSLTSSGSSTATSLLVPSSPKPSSSEPGIKNESTATSQTVSSSVSSNVTSAKATAFSGIKGVWISCYEMPFMGCTEEMAEQKFSDMMKLVASQGYNTVFCHVRANADAFYPSKYFPFAKQLTGTQGVDPGYDPLKIMISAAKSFGLEFHAWINPYRVSGAGTDLSLLSDDNIAVEWLKDGSNRAAVSGNGIYFNPADTSVQKLILNGISEILKNYDVDGIHFDDYFYPSGVKKSFDSKNYKEYVQKADNPLSLEDWRRANVNALVSAVHRMCKKQNVVFGISPMGTISYDNSHETYTSLYADVALWMRQEGYIDYIIPQIYFGYNHPVIKSQYSYLLDIWTTLEKHKKLKLYVGLGAYKMDENCADKEEWHNEDDLLARQVTDAINKGADGFVVFSYDATASEKEHNVNQINNMFKALKSLKGK